MGNKKEEIGEEEQSSGLYLRGQLVPISLLKCTI